MSELVRITVPQLVRLNREGVTLPLYSRSVLSCQAGDYQSPFKGRGMEFEESRLYQPGDDVRNIDWRVTARTNRVHTKLYREERERPVFLFVDFRASMFFATRGRFKSVAAAQLASLLGWSAAYQGDRVGGLLFSEGAHHELKPQRGETSTDGGHPSRSAPISASNPGAEQRSGTKESSEQRPNSSAGDDKAQSKAEEAGNRPKAKSLQEAEDNHPPVPAGPHRNGNVKHAAQSATARSDSPPDEQHQAMEQWLRRIPDDPAGLLRRKFRYQYQQRQAHTGRNQTGDKPW